jgi:chromosome segregation ATPase
MLQEDAMSQELAKLTEENASLQSKLANTARSHAASTHELGRVKADLEGMAADRDKSAKELKAARMRIDDLSSQVR